jgi:hypothetical protein
MSKIFSGAALAAAFLSTSASGVQPAPASPGASARWHLDGATNRCVLTRRLEGTAVPATFILRTIPGSGRYDVILASPNLEDHLGEVRPRSLMTLSLGEARAQVPVSKIELADQLGQGIYIGPLPALIMSAFARSSTIALVGDNGGKATSWTLPAAARAAEAMAACETEKLTDWGADPAALAAGATPARPAENAGSWISPRDLGLHDVLASLSYAAVYRLAVGSDGRVKDCAMLEGAGNVDLSRGCQILRRAARYSPARDASGNPVASVAIHVVDVRTQTDIRIIEG